MNLRVALLLILIASAAGPATAQHLGDRRERAREGLQEAAGLLQAGDPATAGLLAQQAVRDCPCSARGWALLALVRAAQDDRPGAQAALQPALRIARLDPVARSGIQRLSPRLQQAFGDRWPGVPDLLELPPLEGDTQEAVRRLRASPQEITPPDQRAAARFVAEAVQEQPGLTRILVEALDRPMHPSARREVIQALGQSPVPGTWPFIATFLTGQPDEQERVAAAQALSRIGWDAAPAAPLLVEQLRSDNSRVAAASARALGALIAAAPETGVNLSAWEAALQSGLATPDAQVRDASLTALHQFKQAPDGDAAERQGRWARLLSSDDPATIEYALRALQHQVDLQSLLPQIVTLLDSHFPSVQAAAAATIGRWAVGTDAATPLPEGLAAQLRELVGSEDVAVRIEAAAALLALGDQPQRRRQTLQALAEETRLLGKMPELGVYTAGDLAQHRLRQADERNAGATP